MEEKSFVGNYHQISNLDIGKSRAKDSQLRDQSLLSSQRNPSKDFIVDAKERFGVLPQSIKVNQRNIL